jgi:hypothetical protein
MQMEGNSGTYTVATTILVVLQLQQGRYHHTRRRNDRLSNAIDKTNDRRRSKIKKGFLHYLFFY